MEIFQKILQMAGYRIVSGSPYLWDCYGPHARYFDFETSYGVVEIIADLGSDLVFEVFAEPNDNPKGLYFSETPTALRWLNPKFANIYRAESERRDIDPDVYFDGHRYNNISDLDEMLLRCDAILNNRLVTKDGKEYPAVKIPNH